ncbi:hypothetical protein [Microbacterium suwonense]|uniref:CMD domain protein n=1 Tax=Microbacterium suwonense TaxID=683047 RepID=A0ABN6X3J7_9MICO|nr:hypothetical protein [Microbacterium suwonense]BDZ39129.1 hypothetical protein GCM10025863_17430 [Microbacterium suwonense]
MTDVILQIAGLEPDAPRDHRPAVREAAQAAHEALFTVPATDPVPGVDRDLRHLIAARGAWLDGDRAAADWYRSRIQAVPDATDLVTAGADGAAGIRSPRALRAALRYVDLLVTRPASAAADDLNGLRAAGWSPAEIVVIGQIVGLVSYQVRIAQALRVQALQVQEDR